jgi:hypothetical protein
VASVLLNERNALDEIEARLVDEGYRFLRDPERDKLPSFLQGLRPDAIAIGKKPSIVIEVLRVRTNATDTRVQKIRELIEGTNDWTLKVVYLSQYGVPMTMVDMHTITSSLEGAARVTETDPRAGLLIAWATLEATLRHLQPDRAGRSLSPLSLVDLLVSQGLLSQIDGNELAKLARIRNAVAHGQLDTTPSREEVLLLVGITRRLISEMDLSD